LTEQQGFAALDKHEAERFFLLDLDLLCVAGFDGYFKRLNPAWSKVLGYEESELTGRPFLDFVHPDDVVATRAELERLSEGADTIRFEWPATVLRVKTGYKATIKLANDSTRQVGTGLALVLYDANGRPLGAGTTGTTLGTIDPGDSAEFTIEFNHVTQLLERAEQFHLVLEIR